MSDIIYETIARTESPLSEDQLAQFTDWSYWENNRENSTLDLVKDTLLVFFESGANAQKFKIKDNYTRLRVHELAATMGLKTESTGSRKNRTIHIWKPEGYSFFLPEAGEVLEEHGERYDRQGEQSPKETLKEWMGRKYCGDCGRYGDRCELGIRRDGEYQCYECNQEDPYWSAYKWKSLEVMYPDY